MPGSGALTLTGQFVGFPLGPRTVSMAWNLPAAVDESFPLGLNVGDNTVNIPGGSTVVTIEMPPGNSVVVLLKISAGDTGFPLHPGFPSGPIAFPVSATTFILNIAAPLPGPVQISFL